MIKDKIIFGIDISKDTFDVMSCSGKHSQFDNNQQGFCEFLKLLSNDSHCVMEATGYYHYQLAHYLVSNKVLVSVENPLSIKRFIQMKLSRIKTDKSDAKNDLFIWSRTRFATLGWVYKKSDGMFSNDAFVRDLYQAKYCL